MRYPLLQNKKHVGKIKLARIAKLLSIYLVSQSWYSSSV